MKIKFAYAACLKLSDNSNYVIMYGINGAERIMHMAEAEQLHRHAQEKSILEMEKLKALAAQLN